MHIKKNLAIAVAVAVLAVPALGATNASVNADDTTTVTNYLTHSFDGYPAGTPIYNGHYYGGMNGIPKDDMSGSLGHPGNPYNNIPKNDESSHKPVINNKKNTNKVTQTSSNATSSNKPVYQNSKTNNNKLAQTGESNTKVKAGIIGVMAVMVSVAFAGVEKFFKRA